MVYTAIRRNQTLLRTQVYNWKTGLISLLHAGGAANALFLRYGNVVIY